MAVSIADTCQMDEQELKNLFSNWTGDRDNFTFDGKIVIKLLMAVAYEFS
jgi:hypothetical protein